MLPPTGIHACNNDTESIRILLILKSDGVFGTHNMVDRLHQLAGQFEFDEFCFCNISQYDLRNRKKRLRGRYPATTERRPSGRASRATVTIK